jgi:hypothetical protein
LYFIRKKKILKAVSEQNIEFSTKKVKTILRNIKKADVPKSIWRNLLFNI